MSNLDFEAFSKKYSFAIGRMQMRISDKEKRRILAEKLYKDTLAKNIDMDELTNELKMFYQGNIFGQVKIHNYLEKYR